jgi:hypothetical protein
MLFSAKIGAIEIVENTVRVAVVRTGGRRPVLLEVQSRTVHYAEPEDRVPALAQALGDAVDALKNPPVVFILCASGMHSVVRAITIPMRGRKRVLAAARFELEPHLAIPIDELLLDFNLVAEVDGETEVLAVGVRRSHLDNQMAVLAAAGVEVDAVNLDAVALSGLWQTGRKPRKGLQAVLHVREQCSALVVLFNGTIAYFRNMTCGAEAVCTTPGAVAREVQNTLRAFLAKWRAGGEIIALDVTGLDLSPAEQDALSEALRLPVQSEVVLAGISGGHKVLADESIPGGPNVWEAVTGAAFAGAGGVLALNFDQTARTPATVLRDLAPHVLYTSGFALVALMLWAVYYFFGVNQFRAQADQIQQEIDALNKDIEVLAGKGLGENVDVNLFRDPAVLDVMLDISARMSKVLVTSLKLQPPDMQSGWILIQGTTPNAEAVGEVVDALAQSTLFEVDPDISQTAEGNQVSFGVRAYRVAKEAADGVE